MDGCREKGTFQINETELFMHGKHFSTDDYKYSTNSMRWLKDEAVPRIFDFPVHLCGKVTGKRLLLALPFVADAIEFLLNSGHPSFTEVLFVLFVCKLFDLLNSRNPR